MAGFQVANFSFGKNIKDDERQRMAIAARSATARRGQDINAAQADANREEGARQFDERMGADRERLAENARQFDERTAQQQSAQEEGARQFDETQALKKQEYADKRGDVERAQSWDDALKSQQMEKDALEIENRRLAFEKQNAQLDAFLRIKEEEDAQAERRRAAMEGGYGNMAVLAQLQNGTVTRRQVDAFNKSMLADGMMEEGKEYNYIGTVDQTTGEPFEDGRLHFVRYALDERGQVRRDEKSGRPIVEINNPLNPEVRNIALTSYFGNVKEFMGGGRGMSGERMQLERDRIEQRRLEEEGRTKRAKAKNSGVRARLAASVAKNMGDIGRQLKLGDGEAEKFRASLTQVLSDAFAPEGEVGDKGGEVGDGVGKVTVKPYDNISREEKIRRIRELRKLLGK